MTIPEKFIAYLFENYRIGNGDMLTELQENTSIQEDFLRLHNLPEDTNLF